MSIVLNIEARGFDLRPDLGCAQEKRVQDDLEFFFFWHEIRTVEILVRGQDVGNVTDSVLDALSVKCQFDFRVEKARRLLFTQSLLPVFYKCHGNN